MLGLVRAQAQAAPKSVEQEHAQRAAYEPGAACYWILCRNSHAAAVMVTTAMAAMGQMRSATSQNGMSRRNTPRMITMKCASRLSWRPSVAGNVLSSATGQGHQRGRVRGATECRHVLPVNRSMAPMIALVELAITRETMLRSTPNCAPSIGRMKRRPMRISIP